MLAEKTNAKYTGGEETSAIEGEVWNCSFERRPMNRERGGES